MKREEKENGAKLIQNYLQKTNCRLYYGVQTEQHISSNKKKLHQNFYRTALFELKSLSGSVLSSAKLCEYDFFAVYSKTLKKSSVQMQRYFIWTLPFVLQTSIEMSIDGSNKRFHFEQEHLISWLFFIRRDSDTYFPGYFSTVNFHTPVFQEPQIQQHQQYDQQYDHKPDKKNHFPLVFFFVLFPTN